VARGKTRRSAARNTQAELIQDSGLRRALAEVGVFEVNLQSGESFPNKLWLEWGYTPEEMQNREFWIDIIHPDDRKRVKDAHRRIMEGRVTTFEQEYRVQTRSGHWRWMLSSGSVVSWDENGKPLLYVGQDTDITHQKLTEEALREARQEAEQRAQESERLRIAGAIVTSALSVEEAVDLILHQAAAVCPFDGAVVLLREGENLRSLGSMGEMVSDNLVVSLDEELPSVQVYRDEQPRFYPDIAEAFPSYPGRISRATRSWLGIPLIARSEVLGVMSICSKSPNFFTHAHRKVMLAFADHVSIALHNARRYDHTREMAMTDPLTGVGTRHSFDSYAVQHLDLAKRHGRNLSVMMVDMDNFKRINDRHGHPAGDIVLSTVGKLLKEGLRQSDIICRYGGDEFAVLLPETATDEAIELGQRLRAKLETSFSESPYEVSATIGIAGLDQHEAENVWDLLKMADMALYNGKTLGRNRISVRAAT
jgi:diguanylate cyclase (GGDEF)-like protein/PAS domain S-box-containing protein